MWDVLLDALLDTAKLLPFLLVLYILIELLEHKTRIGKPHGLLSGRLAPLAGGVTGLVPLCGFSVMAAKLYERRHITVGTLIAVFLTTSDEAFLVLLTSSMPWSDKLLSLAALCGVKLLVGVSVGYLTDFVCKKAHRCEPLPVQAPECAHEHIHEEHGESEEHHKHGHDEHGHEDLQVCEHHRESNWNLYLLSPLLHTLKVAAFVLLVNFLFGALFYLVGEENVMSFLQAGVWFQPLVACVVGLIPNCASSVVLAETYAVGGIVFGSCMAGLMTNAGLGFVVLFRNAKAWKRNLAILAVTFVAGLAVGYAVNAVAFAAGIL